MEWTKVWNNLADVDPLPVSVRPNEAKLKCKVKVALDLTVLPTTSNMHKTGTQTPSNIQKITTVLEQLSTLTITAVNARDFSTTSPGFKFMAPDFTCNILYDTNSKTSSTDDEPPRLETDVEGRIDLEGNLARFRRLTKEFPEWRLDLVDQSTSIDEDGRKADVFQTLDVMGLPPGIVTRTVLVVEYEEREGVWWCVGNRAVRGMGGE